jgi:hypothetical protein
MNSRTLSTLLAELLLSLSKLTLLLSAVLSDLFVLRFAVVWALTVAGCIARSDCGCMLCRRLTLMLGLLEL